MTADHTKMDGPIVKDVDADFYETNMFKTAEFMLGEPMTDMPSPDNPGPPFFVYVDMPPGTSNTNSHYHPDYSFLMFPTGGYQIGGTFFPPDTVMLTEPGAETGECGPAPEGSTEVAFYKSNWAGVPFFVNPEDPRSAQMLDDLGERGEMFRNTPPTGTVPGASFQLLDRDSHAVATEGFTGYPCQIGPKGFGTVPDQNDPTPYCVLVEFRPGGVIPLHRRNGWAGITIIDGRLDICGVTRGKEAILAFPPGHALAVEAANGPARAIFYFASGQAAIPLFEEPTADGAADTQAIFGKA